jgi:hypothetical protein
MVAIYEYSHMGRGIDSILWLAGISGSTMSALPTPQGAKLNPLSYALSDNGENISTIVAIGVTFFS